MLTPTVKTCPTRFSFKNKRRQGWKSASLNPRLRWMKLGSNPWWSSSQRWSRMESRWLILKLTNSSRSCDYIRRCNAYYLSIARLMARIIFGSLSHPTTQEELASIAQGSSARSLLMPPKFNKRLFRNILRGHFASKDRRNLTFVNGSWLTVGNLSMFASSHQPTSRYAAASLTWKIWTTCTSISVTIRFRKRMVKSKSS